MKRVLWQFVPIWGQNSTLDSQPALRYLDDEVNRRQNSTKWYALFFLTAIILPILTTIPELDIWDDIFDTLFFKLSAEVLALTTVSYIAFHICLPQT